MTDMILRPAVPADADNLATCFRAAYAVYDGQVADLPDVAGGLEQDILEHSVCVAVLGRQVLGGAVLVLQETAQLANVAVDPKAGGKGVGRALIDWAVSTAQQAGYRELWLATHVGMPGNLAMYARLGWQETAR